VEIDDHLGQLQADAAGLAGAAQVAGLDAPIPYLDWSVRDLVTHVGGVHRFAADIVGERRDSLDTAAARAVGTGPGDDELLDWFTVGAASLIETLVAAPKDVEVPMFLPAPSPLAFWARRQAHETAIHRVDAEAAAHTETPFAAEFAQDGIAELLQGFAKRRANAIGQDGRMVLRPDDGPSWVLTLGGERIVAEPGEGEGDLVVAGSSSDVYLWLWNRPSGTRLRGDDRLAELWRQTVRVRWS
jgi:uncharacterized protein (TIGR03083 family)